MEAVLEDIFQSAEFTVKPGQAQAYHHPPFPPPPPNIQLMNSLFAAWIRF